jgi:hypothetical protein
VLEVPTFIVIPPLGHTLSGAELITAVVGALSPVEEVPPGEPLPLPPPLQAASAAINRNTSTICISYIFFIAFSLLH